MSHGRYVDDEHLPPALVNLRRQGFEYYNPRCLERHKNSSGNVVRRPAQLFVDYVFVSVVDRWRSLMATIGVSQLLMSAGGRPAEISQEVIDALRSREDASGMVVMRASRFRKGDGVELTSGPFSKTVGLYDGQSSRDRAFVLLSLLGSSRRVSVNEADLAAI